MRRIRKPVAGETVILEQTAPSRRRTPKDAFVTIRIEVPKTFSVNFDMRLLMLDVRLACGEALAAGAGPDLRKTYTLGAVTGGTVKSRTSVSDRSSTAEDYFARRVEVVLPPILASSVEDWLRGSMATPPHSMDSESFSQLGAQKLPGSARRRLTNAERESRRLAKSTREGARLREG